jgi:hypothetical protein
MDLMYNQNAEKAMTQTQTTPHYHESKPQKTYQPREIKIYRSWLRGLPPLAVFFGRRSETWLAKALARDQQGTHFGECWAGHHLGRL